MRTYGFVEDGYYRARAALEGAVRAEVMLEFEGRLKNAQPDQRQLLREEIEREIERHVQQKAPGDALY